ncbi:MAG: nickel transporter permease [Caldilineaceae bacterium]|jgi:peptide/nickel transport system permease protein
MNKASTDRTQGAPMTMPLTKSLRGATKPVAERTGFWWTLRDLFRRRSAQIGGAIVLLLVVMAIFAPLIAPYDPYAINVKDRLQPPSLTYPFGTDDLGRDLFSRIIYGARTTIQTGVVVVFIAASLGSLIGLISGYYGGVVDLVIMRVIDIMLAFPYILLALAIVATLGPSLQNALIAIGLAYVPGWARFVRGNVLTVGKQEYVTAALATGTRARRIIGRHVLPNVLSSIIVLASLDFPAAVLSTAALSYVGLGAQPPTAEWGALLTGARSYMRTAPWLVNFPGLAIFITMLGFNLLGNALRDTLDPKLRNR